MLNGTPAYPQFAQTRRTYRDIPEVQNTRVGAVFPGGAAAFGSPFAPPFAFGGPQVMPGPMVAPGDPSLGPAFCGALECCPVPRATAAYERIVGLPRVCIDDCDCETIETSVCGPFTLMGLYIAPKVAHWLSITRLQVGCHNLLVNCDPIPAEIFSCCEILGETTITAPTIDANSPICIELENESTKEVEFKGAMYGLLCLACA